MRHNNHDHQSGFTVIELTLAMAFLSFILIFIVTVFVQLLQIYDKGLTLKDANQSGRSISADIKATLRGSESKLINVSRNQTGTDNNRVCLGTTSYVWNENTQTTNRYSGSGTPVVGMARVYDPSGAICSSPTSQVPRATSTELLGPSLRVQHLSIVQAGSPYLYTFKYVLTTSDQTALVPPVDPVADPLGWKCRETGAVIDRNYCGVSTFDTVVFVNK